MITADEARKLAGVHRQEIEDFLKLADEMITKAAKNGKRSTIVRDSYVSNSGYRKGEAWNTVKKILTDRGFEISFFYEERQFVDMGMTIKW